MWWRVMAGSRRHAPRTFRVAGHHAGKALRIAAETALLADNRIALIVSSEAKLTSDIIADVLGVGDAPGTYSYRLMRPILATVP